MSRRVIVVMGRTLEAGTGKPIFDTKVRHTRSRRSTNSDENGKFRIQIPKLENHTNERLVILAPGYWPRVAHFEVRATSAELPDAKTSLQPAKIEGAWWLKLLIGVLPALLNWWFGTTARERVLLFFLLFFLLIPAFLFAVGQGFDIPYTDLDEYIRERLQMLGLSFWKIAPVRYHSQDLRTVTLEGACRSWQYLAS